MVTGGILLLCAVIVSIGGYMAAGWNIVEAFYFVVITIFSVGYEEVHPIDTVKMQLFTSFVVVVGTGSTLYIIGGFMQMVTEGEIKRAMSERSKSRGIDALQDHTIICGFGRMGQILARDLHAGGQAFVIIDTSDGVHDDARECGYLLLQGDASEEKTLQSAGIERAKHLATVISSDAVNVYITLSARTLNPDITILARGELPSTEPKLRQAGADHVILPPAIGGSRLAHMIMRPSASAIIEEQEKLAHINEDLRDLGVELSEIEIFEDSPIVGRRVGQIEVDGALLIVAVRRESGELIRNPDTDTLLKPGDIIVQVIRGGADAARADQEKAAAELVSQT